MVRVGMTPVVADNRRMKDDLLPRLAYPTFDAGSKRL
jgi:hypothetical protein